MGADPVSISVIAAAAAVQMYGQYRANSAQAQAERANAASYAAQNAQAKMASRRESDIYVTESQMAIGETVTSLNKAGIDLSGSALMKVANMKAQAGREYNAILIGAQLNSNIINMREAQARRTANMLASGTYNGIESLGTILNAGAQIATLKSRPPHGGPYGDGGGNYGTPAEDYDYTPTRFSTSWPGREVGK